MEKKDLDVAEEKPEVPAETAEVVETEIAKTARKPRAKKVVDAEVEVISFTNRKVGVEISRPGADIEKPPKEKKPRPPMTEKQKEIGRANLAAGRAKRDENRAVRKVQFEADLKVREVQKEETMKKREEKKIAKIKKIIPIADETDSDSEAEIIIVKKNKVVSKSPVNVKEKIAKIEAKKPEPLKQKPMVLFY
jgi:hypothetical protein